MISAIKLVFKFKCEQSYYAASSETQTPLNSYSHVPNFEQDQKLPLHGIKMPNEINIDSPLPNSMMNRELPSKPPRNISRKLPRELIFSASLFATQGEDDNLHKKRVGYLISIAWNNSQNVLLVIIENNP
jgi:hypothetical protein